MKYINNKSLSILVALLTYATTPHAAELGISGDVSATTSTEDGTNSSFALGALDFFVTEELGEHTRGFVEFVFEDGDDGLVTDLERLWVSYEVSHAFTISAGRFHTPLGNWNRTYHHSAFVQPTVSRPFFLDFEDGAAGILPVHIVGLMATGERDFGIGNISYEAFVANGSSIDSTIGLTATPDNKPELDINGSSDNNDSKTIGVRVILKPADTAIELGLSVMHNLIAESEPAGAGLVAFGETLVDQQLIVLDFTYLLGHFDFTSEFYIFKNDNKVGTMNNNTANADFIQFGYQVKDNLKLIYRHAKLSFDPDDAYFLLLGAEEASHNVIGVNYNLDDLNILKFEANQVQPDTPGSSNETTYTIQWAFLMP